MDINLKERYQRMGKESNGHYSEWSALKIALIVELEMLVIMNRTDLLPELMNQYKAIDQKQFEEMGLGVS